MCHPSRLLLILVAVALPLLPAAAQDKGNPFSLELRLGAEYDSNVAVLELDTSSGEGDVAGLVDLGVAFDKKLAKPLRLKLGYDFSQSLHEEFDSFDLRIHRGSGEVAFDFGRVDAGVTYQYADAELDDEGFLVLERFSPYLSKLFGKRLFLRLAYARSDKEFDTDPARDATADAGSLDAFLFLDGVRRYVVLGYQYHEEDAIGDAFDYTGARIKAQFSRRFARGDRDVELKLGLRHESREYEGAFLPLAMQRDDDRYGFEARVDVPFGEHPFLRVRYEYNDNRSNLPSVDFDEHVVALELGARF